MKKMILLVLAIMVILTACNPAQADPTEPPKTPSAPAATQATSHDPTKAEENKPYSFVLQGNELIPGAVFDEASMPEADSVFQVPSCAIEGTDNVYNYGVAEVTVFDDGKKQVVYSIFLVDANTPTTEGLYLGDDLSQAESIYGKEYTMNGAEVIYQRCETQLILILNSGYIASIEYRMVT